jgi:hypothetical protein
MPAMPAPLSSLRAGEFHAVGSDPGTALALGKTLVAENGTGVRVRLTLTKIRFQKKACYSIIQVPKGKGVLIADLTIQVEAGTFKASEFDFKFYADGQAPTDGFEGGLSGCGTQLSQTGQKAGSTQKASLVFFSPGPHGDVEFCPFPGRDTVGTWTLP